MIFTVGTKVRFKHSGDLGEVVEQLDEQMVSVYLPEDDMTIPAFIEDLERVNDHLLKTIIPNTQKDTSTPKPPKSPTPTPVLREQKRQGQGIQLAFDPIYAPDGSPREYDIVLINDTAEDWLFSFVLSFRGRPGVRQNAQLNAYTFQSVGTLLFDQLNDGPVVDLDGWRITTQGSGPKRHKTLRIKPKSFFKKLRQAPLINREAHLFPVFSGSDGEGKASHSKEDIKAYTRRKLPGRPEIDRFNPFHEVLAMAEFETEIDLHIENLVKQPKKVPPNEILPIQLRHFEAYMDDAIRLGVPRVFIIHGLGTGRLRDAIATRLMRMPEVNSFRNEYHARYGYGATEVILE